MDQDIMCGNRSPGAYEFSIQVLTFMCKMINRPSLVWPLSADFNGDHLYASTTIFIIKSEDLEPY